MPLISPRLAANARLQAAANNSPPLRYGDKGDAVVVLQELLIEFGAKMPNSTGNGFKHPDGIYGQETVRCVSDFQSRNGLMRDGVAGRQTLTTMDALLMRPRPPEPYSTRDWGMKTARDVG